MKKIITIIVFTIASLSCSSQSKKACIIATDFIKENLNYPAEAEISQFNCIQEENSDGTFTVLNKVIAKNGFGVKTEYVFKLHLKHNSGVWTEKNNWKLLKIQSEEYKN